MGNAIVRVLAEQLVGDLEVVLDLLDLVPVEAGGWRPDWPSASGQAPMTVEELARHLVDALGGLCACFARLHVKQLDHWDSLRLRVEGAASLGVAQAADVIRECRLRAVEAFALMEDEDLARRIPTYFVPDGEPWLAVMMGNSKHIQNHAYQLFLYLKLLGLPVGTRHLYRFKAV